jgi:REP element-mobilizing transposase RayT
VVFSKEVDMTLKETYLEIEKRYEVHIWEVGTDKDNVHFLVQFVLKMSAPKIITILKSITAGEIFQKHPEVKEKLLGGNFEQIGIL